MTYDGTKPFRLLNLPSVASSRVIKQMELIELFALSLTTKRTRKTIKSSFAKNYFHVDFDISDNFGIELENENHGPPLKFHGNRDDIPFGMSTEKMFLGEYKIENEKMKMFLKPNGHFSFYWENRKRSKYIMNRYESSSTYNKDNAMRKWIQHFVDVFNNPMCSLSTRMSGGKIFFETMELVKKRNIQLKKVYFSLMNMTSEGYEYVLNECKEINQLHLGGRVPRGFRYDPLTCGVLKLNRLYVADSHWLKLEDFMECKSIQVEIESQLAIDSPYVKAPYLNYFLKKWIASDARIERVGLRFRTPSDFSLVVEGLTSPANKIGKCTGGHYLRIQRHDGKKAVVYYEENYLYFLAGTDFSFVARVWTTSPT